MISKLKGICSCGQKHIGESARNNFEGRVKEHNDISKNKNSFYAFSWDVLNYTAHS